MHVKNIALLGHAGSGKTTLAETMLYEAGLITRRGTVEDKNTVSDYHEIEHERGNSVFSTTLHTTWRGYKINIIDTPGYDDFVGEQVSALRVADTGVMLLNAQMGVEVGTELIWEYTEAFRTPMIFAVNQLDHDKADFEKTVEEARERFGRKVTVVQYPRQQGIGFHEIIDVLKMTMYKFTDEGGKPEKLPIPDEERAKADYLHNELIETIAESDDGLMELYFEKGSLNEDEMRKGLKTAMINHEIFPLFCLSAKRNMGSGRLMGFIDNVAPCPKEMPPQKLKNGQTLECKTTGDPCIFIYKTISEPHLGDMAFFKVFSGEISTGIELVNETTGSLEKINQLYKVEGHKRILVDSLAAGDIGATIKLKGTHTNNTLHAKGREMELLPIQFPEPTITTAIVPRGKADEEKLIAALHKLQEEDPTLLVENSQELRQILVQGQGELHLAVMQWKLEHIFKIETKLVKPRIAYRETIRKAVKSDYRHKKQSGGAGQFAEVHMLVEPYYDGMPEPEGLTIRGKEEHELPWGGKLVFYNCIVGGAIDNRYLPSIQKGILEKLHDGPLTGSHVRDVRVCVYDGKMHAVDSNDISFKIAGAMAFRKAFQEASPQLLEPIYEVEVLTPGEVMGDVMSDLQTRRAIIEGIDSADHYQKVTAKVPLAELYKYSSSLRSIAQGRARHKIRFSDYAPVPNDLQKKLIEHHKEEEMELA